MGFSKKSTDTRAADPAPASAPAPDEPSAPSGLSFFSRFTPPLRSRARNIVDFHVRPAEPHRKYGAGDQVQGAVILTVVKPLRITHLVVSLYGYMCVHKGPNVPASESVIDPAELPSVPTRSSRQKSPGSSYVKLFHDEQPLSGEGRLEPGRYEFNFNLLFPADGLPSSIDFERGTISYMISATLTRPASIGTKTAPRTTVDRKIYLLERVDVGPLPPPRPYTISLEPLAKRSKRKRQPVAGAETCPAAVDTAVSAADPDATRPNENSTEGSLSAIGEDQEAHDAGSHNPRHAVPSDVRSVSSESAVSCSTGPSRGGETTYAPPTVALLGGKQAPALKERTIVATAELLKGGCLPGDMVPIKVSVQHIRRVKSMHGVIATLYRLGRIDSSPPLRPKQVADADARRLDKDEYYPKSKTGLGGLSLSTAGSCSVFRKDLSQSFAPLIIDPDTLSATVTTSVRVPEDVFPTIQGVPFEMISFKYLVEVIVDLGGKLSNQIQGGKPSGLRMSTVGGPLGMTGRPHDGGGTSLTSWGTSIIDTNRLRNHKGLMRAVFELVVGTTDSSRLRGRGPVRPRSSVFSLPVRETDVHDGNWGETQQPRPAAAEDARNDPASAPNDYPRDHAASAHPQPPPQPYPYWDPGPPQPPPAPRYFPPPDIPDESTLTEKERVRRAEQRLLPSQPPEPPPLAGPSGAAAPDNIYDADDRQPPAALDAPTAPTLEDLSADPAPTYHQPTHHQLPPPPPPPPPFHPTEDKQELERRRLLAEASAPPDFPDDYDHASTSTSAAANATAPPRPPPPTLPSSPSMPPPSAPPMTDVDFAPSAPALDDVEDHERGGSRDDGNRAAGANSDVRGYAPQYAYLYGAASGSGSASASAEAEARTRAEREGEGGDGEEEEESEPLPRYER